MGYAICTSACFGCGLIFGYNPHKVPSIRVTGERRPVCQACVDVANPQRIAIGLEPITVQPGAYEAIREEEL